jgi:hypothetical protein
MKNSMIMLASLVAAGAVAAGYWIKRKRTEDLMKAVKPGMRRTHHRTNVFANAKT